MTISRQTNLFHKLDMAFETLKNEISSSDLYANDNYLIDNITKLVEKAELPDTEEINNLLGSVDNEQHSGSLSHALNNLTKAKDLIKYNEDWVNNQN